MKLFQIIRNRIKSEQFRNKAEEDIWVTKNGEKMLVTDMTKSHIRNCLKLLYNREKEVIERIKCKKEFAPKGIGITFDGRKVASTSALPSLFPVSYAVYTSYIDEDKELLTKIRKRIQRFQQELSHRQEYEDPLELLVEQGYKHE